MLIVTLPVVAVLATWKAAPPTVRVMLVPLPTAAGDAALRSSSIVSLLTSLTPFAVLVVARANAAFWVLAVVSAPVEPPARTCASVLPLARVTVAAEVLISADLPLALRSTPDSEMRSTVEFCFTAVIAEIESGVALMRLVPLNSAWLTTDPIWLTIDLKSLFSAVRLEVSRPLSDAATAISRARFSRSEIDSPACTATSSDDLARLSEVCTAERPATSPRRPCAIE